MDQVKESLRLDSNLLFQMKKPTFEPAKAGFITIISLKKLLSRFSAAMCRCLGRAGL